ncbi:unnamed protein product, partial [Rotaria magnacalcarata]
MRSGAAERTEI